MPEMKMQTQRQKQKEATRKHILETAMVQFAEKGLTTTPTADIAREAKVSHGTIFVHFPTQEELLTAVIDEFGSRIGLRLHQLADVRGTLEEILRAHLTGLEEFEAFYTKLVIERRLLPESARNTYVMIQSTISFHIGMAAEREMERGTLRRIPVHMLYNTWLGMIHYYLANGDLFAPHDSVLKRHGQELLQNYIKLITL